MKAWQFESKVSGRRFTLSDAEIASMKIDIYEWSLEHGYEIVGSIDLGEEKEEEDD